MAYQEREWLHREYVEKRRTTYDIAEECGVSDVTIGYWLDKHDIERRDRSESQIQHRAEPPTMTVDGRGYERFFVTNGGDRRVVRVHQLVAIAGGADPHKLFDGYDVHHKNGIEWDNREDNLEVMKHDEHRRQHAINENRQ